MSFHWNPREQFGIGRYLLKWILLASAVGILSGSASALFLVSLNWATDTRVAQPWLLYLLPVGGLFIGLAYHTWGRNLEKGNNLLLEEIHRPKSGVPGRLAPAILLATVGTHLFGGSAGREGTAVQMGGSLAGWLARRLLLERIDTRTLLLTGISAGFGSVFGTPLAGAVFGLEVLAVGRIRYDALIPCLIASLVGDWTCTAWGVHHTHYAVAHFPEVTPLLFGKAFAASLAFALAAIFFGELTHWCHWLFKTIIPWAPGRPVVGGLCIIAMTMLVGTHDYLGLGVPMIVQSFNPDGVPTWAFLWKLLFTAVTLGAGFKGGEVTPLFFIGATLGSTLGPVLGLPSDYLAAIGFVAVFAGAANTPLACTLMGIELFGERLAVPLAIACCTTYIWTGHRGIYLSQRVDTPKTDDPAAVTDVTLGSVRSLVPHPRWIRSLVRLLLENPPPKTPLHPPTQNGDRKMKKSSRMATHKLGLVRIYLKTKEQSSGGGWLKRLSGRPLFQEIIDLAHSAELKGATAKLLHYGYSNHGEAKAAYHPEAGHVGQNVYIELIDTRERLEAFVASIAPKVADRVILFKEIEFWNPAPTESHVADEVALLEEEGEALPGEE